MKVQWNVLWKIALEHYMVAEYMCSVTLLLKSTFATESGNAKTQEKRRERNNEHIVK